MVTDSDRRGRIAALVDTSGPSRRQMIAASLAAVLAAAGLIAFAHLDAFDGSNDPFPHSVVAPTG